MNKRKPQSPFPGFTNPPEPTAEIRQTARGRFKVSVVDAKTGDVVETRPWQANLILDAGLDFIATASWAAQLAYCVAGTGSTPTKDLPDPGDTFSQSGTTVTRTAGTRDFISGDVGKLIRWTSGEEAKITAFTNATTVTVGTSQTVASGAIDALYRVAQTGLATETKRTNTQPNFIDDDDGLTAAATILDAAAGTLTLKVTRDFTEEVAPVNYTEIGMSSSATVASNLFSRMLLSGAVTVGAGQLLRVQYELTIACQGHAPATQTTVDGGISGWPLPYNIVSIVSNGSYWDVTLNESHHFVAGGKFNINGAKRPRTTITVAASTISQFTLTAPGHAITAGQSITVEGMTPSGYNGTFTVDSVAGNDIIVLSVLNPGAGTVFGNVRQTEPVTWYDGTDYTIASIPSAAVVRITNATSIAAAGADGTAYNNTKRKFVAVGMGIAPHAAVGAYGAPNQSQFNAYCGSLNSSGGDAVAGYGLLQGNAQYPTLSIPTTPPTPLPNDFPQYWGYSAFATQFACRNTSGTGQSPAPPAHVPTGSTVGALESAYTAGNFYRDTTVTFGAGSANVSNLTFIALGVGRATGYDANDKLATQGYILFEEPQRKKNTYKLTLTMRRSWGRDLTVIPN